MEESTSNERQQDNRGKEPSATQKQKRIEASGDLSTVTTSESTSMEAKSKSSSSKMPRENSSLTDASSMTTQQQEGGIQDSTTSSVSNPTISLDSKTNNESNQPTINSKPKKEGKMKGKNSAKSKKTTSTTALRKGKWATEEEEYTSRVIQHFSAGLLTLPEGATLRSYLAEKLNCDPMRITKKFTGACCLGRRVYHLRDRPRATPTELDLAKAERDHLEQRFRLRIDHEQNGLPLSKRRDILFSQPPPNQMGINTLFPSLQGYPPGNALAPWIQQLLNGAAFAATTPSNNPLANLTGTAATAAATKANGGANHQQAITPISATLNSIHSNLANRLLMPGVGSLESITNNRADSSLYLLNNIVNTWAAAQAAANNPPPNISSLSKTATANGNAQSKTTPTLSATSSKVTPALDLQAQLRRAYEEQRKEEEQRQLRAAFEEEQQRKKLAKMEEERQRQQQGNQPKDSATRTSSSSKESSKSESKRLSTEPALPVSTVKMSPAEQLKKSYEAHLRMLQEQSHEDNVDNVSDAKLPKPIADTKPNNSSTEEVPSSSMISDGSSVDKAMDDQEAGNVLLALRQSYEAAVEAKNEDELSRPKNEVSIDKHTNASESSEYNVQKKKEKKTKAVDGHTNQRRQQHPQKEEQEVPAATVSGGQQGNLISSAVSQFMKNSNANRKRPASVTDVSSGNSSSQPTELSSSMEDSSDKSGSSEASTDKTDQSSSDNAEEDSSDKTDQSSSSEDDDKEDSRYRNDSLTYHGTGRSDGMAIDGKESRISKGPPRKRIKASFTKENLLYHSRRMSQQKDNQE